MKTIVEGYERKKHPLYGTWLNMRDRCNNPNNKDFKFYGECGISVCKEWDDFVVFVNDLKAIGDRPEGFTLDRIDSSKNYEPTNVQWSSKSRQARNQKRRSTNKTGTPGVNKMKCGGYIARIRHNGERIYIGYFKNLEDAVQARLTKEKELDWHNVK
jgi:hypothetical protein